MFPQVQFVSFNRTSTLYMGWSSAVSELFSQYHELLWFGYTLQDIADNSLATYSAEGQLY